MRLNKIGGWKRIMDAEVELKCLKAQQKIIKTYISLSGNRRLTPATGKRAYYSMI